MILSKEEQFHYKLLGIDPSKIYIIHVIRSCKLILLYDSGPKINDQLMLISIHGIPVHKSIFVHNYANLSVAYIQQENTHNKLINIITVLLHDPHKLLDIIDKTCYYSASINKNNVTYIIDKSFDLDSIVKQFLRLYTAKSK